MYGVAGERRLEEWQADWLPGYENSVPVRIGNAAVSQLQLDVYGEVIDAITLGSEAGLSFDSHTWSLVRALLRFLEKNWDQPDEGIWEVRGPRRNFVHSKVMAWVAFDRAVRAAELGQPGAEARWREIRDQIHAEVCEKGYDAKRGTFTQYYGSTELDAAVLLIPEVGFLPPDDPRVVSTVETIQTELTSGGLVLRYTQPAAAAGPTNVDGLTGSEGAFLACSFWLVNALHMIGQDDDARAAVRAAAGHAQRRRPAQRGVRPALQPPGRQLPAGIQPHAADPVGAQSGAARGPPHPARGRANITRRLMPHLWLSHGTASPHSGRQRPQGPPAGLRHRRPAFGSGPPGARAEAIPRASTSPSASAA